MRAIWKYPVEPGRDKICPPGNSRPLHFGFDPNHQPCVWFECSPDHESLQEWTIDVVLTGQKFVRAASGEYLGTTVNPWTGIVLHCYFNGINLEG